MKLSTAVHQYMLDASLELAKRSQVSYRADLESFTQHVAAHATDSVLAFTPEHVRSWFLLQSSKGRTMNTLHRKRAALNQFAKWCLRKKYATTDPMLEAPKIRLQKKLPRPLGKLERTQVMTLELPVQDRLLRDLLYYTGLRIEPLLGIRWRDIIMGGDGMPLRIRTLGKGSKEQLIFLVPEVRATLQDYILQKTNLRPDPSAFLFPYPYAGGAGRAMTAKQARKRTAAWGRMVDPPIAKCVPHRFRHSFATELHERGVPIRKIQQLMNHADVSTTQIYVEVADQELEDAIMTLSAQKRDGLK